ncbi:hypothetical protein [Saccharothrix obliqua]|uniref:hypothetical protein n=1 Tax=Saccharothrix obliqua TaxID=2861747 RepID=UPI001C5DF7C5|nr:hypothetical protein [Saccharothrix obliqua]MBW4716401.1 hypothetical protein [Saccharothrix obliqua]
MTSSVTGVKNILIATKTAPKDEPSADRYNLEPDGKYVLELFACDHGGHSDGIWVCYQLDTATPEEKATGTENMSYHDRVPISGVHQVAIWARGDDVDRNGRVFYTLYRES